MVIIEPIMDESGSMDGIGFSEVTRERIWRLIAKMQEAKRDLAASIEDKKE